MTLPRRDGRSAAAPDRLPLMANRSTRPSRWPVPSWWPAARACPDLVACGLPGPVRVVVGKSNPDKTGQAVLGYPVHRASLCRPGGLVLGLR